MIAGAFLAVGCAAVLDLDRATPLPPGELRTQVGVGVVGVHEQASPIATFGVRTGVAQRMDMGASAWVGLDISGLVVDATFGIATPEASPLRISVAPRVGAVGVVGVVLPGAELATFVALDTGRGAQLAVSPAVGAILGPADPSATLSLRLGWVLPSRKWRIVPGVGWTAHLSGESPVQIYTGGTSFTPPPLATRTREPDPPQE